jgi:hypothetical protein
MVYINTLMLQQILAQPKWANKLTPRDLRALTHLLCVFVFPLVHDFPGGLLGLLLVFSDTVPRDLFEIGAVFRAVILWDETQDLELIAQGLFIQLSELLQGDPIIPQTSHHHPSEILNHNGLEVSEGAFEDFVLSYAPRPGREPVSNLSQDAGGMPG